MTPREWASCLVTVVYAMLGMCWWSGIVRGDREDIVAAAIGFLALLAARVLEVQKR